MILYVSELRPDLLDELGDKLYMVVTKAKEDNLKRFVIGGASDFSHATRFVVDLSSMKDTNDGIVEAISSFKTMYPGVRVIVIADKEPENSAVFARLFDIGVYDIVRDIGGDELRKCLTDGTTKEDAMQYRVEKPDLTANAVRAANSEPVPQAHSPPTTAITTAEHTPRERITANRDFKKHKQFVTIAVCGTEPHIGATHHALLIAKFLSGIGFKVCYLEASERRNIFYLAKLYAVNVNERKHLLQFEGVDMFCDFRLPDVISAGYDFYIFDLGRFGELEPASFTTKDVKLIVGGSKAWELPAYTPVFRAIEGIRGVKLILNHAPNSETQNLRGLMNGCKTYFSEYAPYPFASGVNLDIYKDIFADYLTVEKSAATQEQTGKTRFWNRRK